MSLIREALAEASRYSTQFEARLLMCHCLGISISELLMRLNDEIPSVAAATMNELLKKRASHVPLQYLLGEWEFMGLPFYVSPDVLIPRPDTETLVLNALEIIRRRGSGSGSIPTVLDMCCGSGCIGLSIAKLSGASVTLADISEKALSIAQKNAKRLLLDVSLIQSDMFDAITDSYDIITCNPPYIRTDDILTLSKEVQCEPVLALDGGSDGLSFYRRLRDGFSRFLNLGGSLLLEVGASQARDVMSLFGSGIPIFDMNGVERVIIIHKDES